MQENETYRMVMRRGPQPNEVFELSGEVLNLGRDITNDLVINDREVSRHHLRFMRGAGGYTIEDLGSTNGTFVNGRRVSGATTLKNGDMLGLGETVTLGYEVVRAGAGAEAAQAPQQPTVQSGAADDNQFRPPEQQPQAQPPNPYLQPESAQQPQPQPAAQQESYQQQPDPQYAAQGAYGGPPPPGYDYDPYAMREEEGTGMARWLLIGCVGLMLLCCCLTIVGAVLIDAANLYCDVPILRDILEALGLLSC